MTGEVAVRDPEERSGEGKRLMGYCDCDWKHLQGVVSTRKEGRQVQRRDQDWNLSSCWDLPRLTP